MATNKKLTEEQRLKKREKELNKQANLLKKQLKNEEKRSVEYKTQNDLMNYIVEQYGLIFIPQYLSRKLCKIRDGTYDGLAQPIPFADLLNMFQFFKKELNEAKKNKLQKGETMSPISQINYDLAVIINHYQEYYDSVNKSKEKLQQSLDMINDKLEKTIAQQDIAKKKKRLAELEKAKREREQEDVDLSELFSDF